MRILLTILSLLAAGAALAETTAPRAEGEVRVPLERYTQLVDDARRDPRPAPAGYALGVSRVEVVLTESHNRTAARVHVTLGVETFENEWTLVPVLPPGAALEDARIDGAPVRLVQGPDGLAWSTDEARTATLELRYGIDAHRSEAGYSLPIPVPRAAATALSLRYPGTGVDFAVVPGADVKQQRAGSATLVTASIPSTSSILVSWRTALERRYAVSRARYVGELHGDALLWTALFDVEIIEGERVELPLMPSDVTLGDVRVDGEQATVLEDEGKFATAVEGRGMHEVEVRFQVPVLERDGPPQAHLRVPRIPVSHFELTLPGKKEVSVEPRANVVTTEQEGATQASVFVPMSESIVFSWVDAVPEDVRTRVRANASVYHAVHADEGVLHGHAVVVHEISRGETNQLHLRVPRNAQVNRIVAPSGGVSDWIETQGEDEQQKSIDVFLDRGVKGEFVLDVFYEHLLGSSVRAERPVAVPLVSAAQVQRQRGMVALLAGPELTLEPVGETRLSRVGENQLPAFVRNQLGMSVTHTYKYIDREPELVVRAAAPERKQGKFDAQVDTLISIGEVTMKGSATVEVSVKSGAIMALRLRIPDDVNVLGVSGPSLRSHEIRDEADGQSIDLAFTQEMEGQFRLEVDYERIMEERVPASEVPTVSVADAEVEHGRIAVEALTAVEVQAVATEQLSSLEFDELPQQLVLKTTNPILLAYKYVHVDPPYRLALKITRHSEIDVQVAAIEKAAYSTLFTRDGLAVSTARFDVRNSRRQFLRLDLPADSEVWSVFVDGKPEKPAHAGDAADGTAVLIKMINSAAGFPVEIVYATRGRPMEFTGRLSGHLPTPDMVVTHSRWDVFLPTRAHYHSPQSTLDPLINGRRVNPRSMGAAALITAENAQKVSIGRPLRINVPTQGIHYAFEKLYANQSPRDATFSIRYTSAEGNRLGLATSGLGALLVWAGILALGIRRPPLGRSTALATIGAGVVLLVAAIGYLGTSPVPASAIALAVAVAVSLWLGVARLRRWLSERSAA